MPGRHHRENFGLGQKPLYCIDNTALSLSRSVSNEPNIPTARPSGLSENGFIPENQLQAIEKTAVTSTFGLRIEPEIPSRRSPLPKNGGDPEKCLHPIDQKQLSQRFTPSNEPEVPNGEYWLRLAGLPVAARNIAAERVQYRASVFRYTRGNEV
jgi:hypothetical protein